MSYEDDQREIIRKLDKSNELTKQNTAVGKDLIAVGKEQTAVAKEIARQQDRRAEEQHQDSVAKTNAINAHTAETRGLRADVYQMNANMIQSFDQLANTVIDSSRAICDQLENLNYKIDNPSRQKAWESFRKAWKAYDDRNYSDALEYALEAAREYKTEPRFWFFAGAIYRNGRTVTATGKNVDVTDPNKSISAFENAADRIEPDAAKEPDAAAAIWFCLGMAYLEKAEKTDRGWLAKAENALEKAGNYFPEMREKLQARYNLARCRVFQGNVSGALQDLNGIILKDYRYCEAPKDDPDFNPIRDEFLAMIDRMRRDLYPAAKREYDEIQNRTSRLRNPPGYLLARLLNSLPNPFTEDVPYFAMRQATDDSFPRIKELIQAQAEEEERQRIELYRRAKAVYDEIPKLKEQLRKPPSSEVTQLLDALPNPFTIDLPYDTLVQANDSLLQIKALLLKQIEEERRRRAAAKEARGRISSIIATSIGGLVFGLIGSYFGDVPFGGIVGLIGGGLIIGGIVGLIGTLIANLIGRIGNDVSDKIGLGSGFIFGAAVGVVSGLVGYFAGSSTFGGVLISNIIGVIVGGIVGLPLGGGRGFLIGATLGIVMGLFNFLTGDSSRADIGGIIGITVGAIIGLRSSEGIGKSRVRTAIPGFIIVLIAISVIGGAGDAIAKNAADKVGAKAKALAEEVTGSQTTATVTSDALNVRAGSSADTAVVIQVHKGDVLTVTGEPVNGWLPVEFNGKSGWVSAGFVQVK